MQRHQLKLNLYKELDNQGIIYFYTSWFQNKILIIQYKSQTIQYIIIIAIMCKSLHTTSLKVQNWFEFTHAAAEWRLCIPTPLLLRGN